MSKGLDRVSAKEAIDSWIDRYTEFEKDSMAQESYRDGQQQRGQRGAAEGRGEVQGQWESALFGTMEDNSPLEQYLNYNQQQQSEVDTLNFLGNKNEGTGMASDSNNNNNNLMHDLPLFSPQSAGAGRNFSDTHKSSNSPPVLTPTLKVEMSDAFLDSIVPGSAGNEVYTRQPVHQNSAQFLSPRTDFKSRSGSFNGEYASDFENDIVSGQTTPYLSPRDASTNSINNLAVSPSASISSFQDEFDDDLLSVYSNSSNILLPVNSRGLKHVNDLDDLDILMNDIIDEKFLHTYKQTGGTTTGTADTSYLKQFAKQSPPTISVQECYANEATHNPRDRGALGDQSPDTPDGNFNVFEGNALFQQQGSFTSTVSPQKQLYPPIITTTTLQDDDNDNGDDDDDNAAASKDLINGRKLRRKNMTRAKSISRSRNRGRQSSDVGLNERVRSVSENRDLLVELADPKLDPESNPHFLDSLGPTDLLLRGQTVSGGSVSNVRKNPAIYACDMCDKKFTRPYNLKSHLRTHTNERPFVCSICGKAFARQHDRKRHEDLHSGKKRYICGGTLKDGTKWGCGKKFARSDALGRHFKTEAGKRCISLLYEEAGPGNFDDNASSNNENNDNF
ncbi:DNA-binding transcription factor CRZ1 KNAG_0H01930 [Huiozyma naganishii CBS 8797]|uniref:C2H2-type domain-containing protein n=1 Tax=Huiozyma naganishii (strain ATCC MYA-139 / BCRC 22969 / CBS 8797 / KCTC 17520 / NBRC 10181 / NCYC 3082 / Yp74L-3) TaxID=1071383 RepID=J7S1S5_HUIN7|nr:hypothetical protein KNAG_0H01930 [Kazachstania naganishii CBS 8797]CCK71607.1 hypothetical protein KNAG_0H01930 [Kazachstania naganishii CBS 8797]